MFSVLKYPRLTQYWIGISSITVTSLACYFAVDLIGYQVVALLLLLVVSVLAMVFDILPVLLTAFLSALVWNFFFIPPLFTFLISTTEDALMFLMYFMIALINAVLTFKIRQTEKKAREKEGREKTIHLYNTLLNSLSHELRTPISAIIGAIDTIKENESRLSSQNRTELYTEIAAAGFRLNRQVENLLNMSRLEAGILQPKKDWCDINELVFSVLKDNREDAQYHELIFEPDSQLPLCKIDRGLTGQVMHNLIHNALQHTPPGTAITIHVATDGGCCIIKIADDGEGFPEKEIEYVFDKFYRLTNTAAGGTGLGLSIVKGFTEALGGTILLKNQQAGGAKFTVKIPAETSSINEVSHE